MNSSPPTRATTVVWTDRQQALLHKGPQDIVADLVADMSR